MFQHLPHSILQTGTIFLSIVIEALPFVLLGCIISGGISVLLTPERIRRCLPKNRFLSVVVGCLIGFFFPSCECGIVPIVNQFIKKDVPVPTAFSFMLTAPVINPIVIFSTFIAFGNSWRFALLRVVGSFTVALVVGVWLSYFNHKPVMKPATVSKETDCACHSQTTKKRNRVNQLFLHAIDEFFDTGRYLIIGSLIAAALQVYLPTRILLTFGSTKLLAIIVMLLLAVIMSLCSEADAFIGASLLGLFGTGPVIAFLVFGPVVDIKNLLMMKRYFTTNFMLRLVAICSIVIATYAYFV